MIALDNTLRAGRALDETNQDPDLVAIRKINIKLAQDTKRVFVVQLNIGDGYTIATKI